MAQVSYGQMSLPPKQQYKVLKEWVPLSIPHTSRCISILSTSSLEHSLFRPKLRHWQLVPLLTNIDISLIMRGRLYSSCVWSSMLHESETWPVRKENKVALQRAEMRMVRWMSHWGKRVANKELRERLGLDDIISVLQQNRVRWYGHVLQKTDNEEMYGVRSGGFQTKRWTKEDLERGCARHVNWTGRMLWIVVDGRSWQRIVGYQNRCEWVNVSSATGWPG